LEGVPSGAQEKVHTHRVNLELYRQFEEKRETKKLQLLINSKCVPSLAK